MRLKPKMLMIVALAVLAGLGASVATSKYFGRKPDTTPVQEDVTVLVAKQRVPGYTVLDEPEHWFEAKTLHKNEVPRDAVQDVRKARGRTLRTAVDAGKVLAEADLLPPGQEPLVAKLREGERLMTVKVTLDSAAGGFILPGSRVDVVATQMRGEGNEPYARTILQNIEVLAIDQQPQIPEGTIAKTYDRVTLRVTLEQAEILSVYADTGSLRLVARRPDDTQEVKTSGASPSWHKRLTGLVAEAPAQSAPAVASLPPTQPSVRQRFKQTIINNGQVRVYEYDAEESP